MTIFCGTVSKFIRLLSKLAYGFTLFYLKDTGGLINDLEVDL